MSRFSQDMDFMDLFYLGLVQEANFRDCSATKTTILVVAKISQIRYLGFVQLANLRERSCYLAATKIANGFLASLLH